MAHVNRTLAFDAGKADSVFCWWPVRGKRKGGEGGGGMVPAFPRLGYSFDRYRGEKKRRKGASEPTSISLKKGGEKKGGGKGGWRLPDVSHAPDGHVSGETPGGGAAFGGRLFRKEKKPGRRRGGGRVFVLEKEREREGEKNPRSCSLRKGRRGGGVVAVGRAPFAAPMVAVWGEKKKKERESVEGRGIVAPGFRRRA